ncbi:TIGR02680 family protein [Marinactinospora rubrisoli]|uniref:TIGR02680 family protein n=1 Tax=Marinactinospora rubrisoli TaxID=2715399 RepID=A0ABW2KMS9_9ACTN
MTTNEEHVDGEATPGGRWRLHRGGVVNIWQYGEQVFDLSGGRVILKGTNGSGKSRTLELLLPLCLDGDLRNMGCKGFDTVSMSRLMLDDYADGASRLGYAWIELRREPGDGTEEYLTCGIGVKASRSSGQVTDSWRFVTPLRVNLDFPLLEQGVPPGPARLREHLGGDAVVPGQDEFRERVAAAVYGINGGSRYTDLLHLQRTLRNPDIGLKVLQGQLEQLLTDALPPVDPQIIRRTATGLDNLEGVRRNVARLRQADAALQEFLQSYRGYARAVLADRADRLDGAEAALARAEGALERREREQAERRTALEQARRERDAAEERVDAIDTELAALKASPAYSALGELADRIRAVESQRAHVAGALRHAESLRAAEGQSVAAVERAAAALARVGAAVAGTAEDARVALRAVGLPSALAALPGLEPDLTRPVETARVLLSPDPQARPEELTRELAPRVDTAELAARAATAAGQVAAAREAVAQRAPILVGLLREGERLEEAESETARLAERAAELAEIATAADQRVREAADRLRAVAGQWTEAVASWRGRVPVGEVPATVAADLPPVPATDDVLADPEAFRDAHREVRAALREPLREAQRAVVVAERDVADAAAERARLERELARLWDAAEVALPAPALTTAARDPWEGAPFYQLVDFTPDLPVAEQAGLEAALHACGLLNAWVRPDGAAAAADGDDTLAAPTGSAPAGCTLADVLRPAVDAEGPVPTDRVAALLRSVPLLPGGPGATATGPAVGLDGTWRSGVLAGRHRKEEAEHIGAGARAQARKRHVAELEGALAGLAEREAEHAAALAAAQRRQEAWTACVDAFPDIAETLRAHYDAQGRRGAARRATSDTERAEAEHARARARLHAERAEHQRQCGALGVGSGVGELREIEDGVRAAARTLDRMAELLGRDHSEAVRAVEAAYADHERTAERRAEAEADAREAHRGYAEAEATLRTLRGSLGQDAEAVSERVRLLQEERSALRGSVPATRDAVDAAIRALSDADNAAGNAGGKVADARAAVADAEDALTDTAGVPGVWEAATGTPEPPFERSELRTALRAGLAENAGPSRRDLPALEREVTARIQTLQTALAGSHDVQADRAGTVLTVAVSEEAGTTPVAVTARRTAERLAEAERNLSGREERIFEEFLLGDITEDLRRQIHAAERLTERMNAVLADAHSSQGVRVALSWEPAPDLDPAERSALALAKKSVVERTDAEDERLRRSLTERIRATRAEGRSSGYAEVLASALDYRQWYTYRVRIHDTGPDGRPRNRRVRQLSSGETRLVSYVTLFAASAAFYDTLQADESTIDGPLRLVLLDEAFERLDDPTIARLLELLVDLDMDWAITWPSGWGVSPKIERMHIYDILKRKGAWGVACAQYTWNGSGFEQPAA